MNKVEKMIAAVEAKNAKADGRYIPTFKDRTDAVMSVFSGSDEEIAGMETAVEAARAKQSILRTVVTTVTTSTTVTVVRGNKV